MAAGLCRLPELSQWSPANPPGPGPAIDDQAPEQVDQDLSIPQHPRNLIHLLIVRADHHDLSVIQSLGQGPNEEGPDVRNLSLDIVPVGAHEGGEMDVAVIDLDRN